MLLNQSKLVCFLGVILAASIGATIRYQIVQQDLLWLDELHTSWVTADSLGSVATRASLGNQSPLYFWLAWPITQQFGQSPFSLRLISLVSGVLLIFLTAYLAWSWTKSALAVFVVAWLIALDPGFVFYGTEARPYALLQLLSVIQVLCFWNLLTRLHETDDVGDYRKNQPATKPVIGIGIATALVSAAVFICHYTGIWLLVVEALFVAGYLVVSVFYRDTSFQIRRALTTLTLLAFVVTLLCIPAGLHLIEVFDRRDNWIVMSSVSGLLNQLRWPLLLSIVLPTLCAAVFYFPNKEKIDGRLFGLNPMDRNVAKFPFVLLWAGVPIGSVLLLDWFGIAPVASLRYTLVGSAAIPLFAGVCVGVSGKWYGQLAVAAILTATSFVQGYENQRIVYNPIVTHFLETQSVPMLRLENWKDTIAEINLRQDKLTHPVMLYSNLIEDVQAFANADPAFQDYLMFPVSGIHAVDRSNRVVFAAPTLGVQHFRPTDIELMKQQGGGWLIIRTRDPGFVGVVCDELRAMAMLLAELEQEDNPEQQVEGQIAQPTAQFIRFPMSPIPSQSVYLSDVYLVSIDW